MKAMKITMHSRTARTTPRVRGVRFVFLVAISVALALSLPSWAKKRKTLSTPTDVNYTAALATANRFLAAWQNNDQEAGLPLITNRAKHQSTEADIDALFSGSSARAFEIAHGRQLSRSRYQFPVLLLQADESGRARRRFTGIVIIETGKNDWAVDKLP